MTPNPWWRYILSILVAAAAATPATASSAVGVEPSTRIDGAGTVGWMNSSSAPLLAHGIACVSIPASLSALRSASDAPSSLLMRTRLGCPVRIACWAA